VKFDIIEIEEAIEKATSASKTTWAISGDWSHDTPLSRERITSFDFTSTKASLHDQQAFEANRAFCYRSALDADLKKHALLGHRGM
jgi:hypothetical protein